MFHLLSGCVGRAGLITDHGLGQSIPAPYKGLTVSNLQYSEQKHFESVFVRLKSRKISEIAS
jgi:hypothetical protein